MHDATTTSRDSKASTYITKLSPFIKIIFRVKRRKTNILNHANISIINISPHFII